MLYIKKSLNESADLLIMKSLNKSVDFVIWLFPGQLVWNPILRLMMNMFGRNPIIFTECKQDKFLNCENCQNESKEIRTLKKQLQKHTQKIIHDESKYGIHVF